jgi:hypothetical protein
MEMEELKDEMTGDIKTEYLEQYFGKKKDYYLPKLQALENGEKYSFNLNAFLFGVFWVLYRRMYFYVFILLLVAVAESKLEKIILDRFGNTYDMQMSLRLLWLIIFGTVLGNFGNYFFLEYSKKKVKKIISTTDDEEIRMKKLKKSGSGNWIIIVSIALVLVLSLILGKK